ncbi:MAG TPA: hypothetical protein VGH47_04470 [Xanthobacteraceae bacterium]
MGLLLCLKPRKPPRGRPWLAFSKRELFFQLFLGLVAGWASMVSLVRLLFGFLFLALDVAVAQPAVGEAVVGPFHRAFAAEGAGARMLEQAPHVVIFWRDADAWPLVQFLHALNFFALALAWRDGSDVDVNHFHFLL